MKVNIPDQLCPGCGIGVGAATQVGGNGATPQPKTSIGMCMNCGAVFTFDDKMKLRHATDVELEELPVDALLLILKMKLAAGFLRAVIGDRSKKDPRA